MTRLFVCVGLFVSLPFGTPPPPRWVSCFLQDATQLWGRGKHPPLGLLTVCAGFPLWIAQLQWWMGNPSVFGELV